jgi:hypothetical protein
MENNFCASCRNLACSTNEVIFGPGLFSSFGIFPLSVCITLLLRGSSYETIQDYQPGVLYGADIRLVRDLKPNFQNIADEVLYNTCFLILNP